MATPTKNMRRPVRRNHIFAKDRNATHVESISMTPATASIAVGATQQMAIAFTPADADNKNVAYTSSAPAVATVNASGLVTGVSAGSATITATTEDGAKTDTSDITVTAAP